MISAALMCLAMNVRAGISASSAGTVMENQTKPMRN